MSKKPTELVKELKEKRNLARQMGGAEKLDRRRKAGSLNAQERLDALVDPDSFLELGVLGASVFDEDKDSTPRDGKIVGFGKINERNVGVVVNDFTVKGASTSTTNSRKMGYIRKVCNERGLPLVHIGESTGARLPDELGSKGDRKSTRLNSSHVATAN